MYAWIQSGDRSPDQDIEHFHQFTTPTLHTHAHTHTYAPFWLLSSWISYACSCLSCEWNDRVFIHTFVSGFFCSIRKHSCRCEHCFLRSLRKQDSAQGREVLSGNAVLTEFQRTRSGVLKLGMTLQGWMSWLYTFSVIQSLRVPPTPERTHDLGWSSHL